MAKSKFPESKKITKHTWLLYILIAFKMLAVIMFGGILYKIATIHGTTDTIVFLGMLVSLIWYLFQRLDKDVDSSYRIGFIERSKSEIEDSIELGQTLDMMRPESEYNEHQSTLFVSLIDKVLNIKNKASQKMP